MEKEIINKVASSALEVFDLEDYYPKGERAGVDISQWLHEGFLLREKDFRASLKDHNWQQYLNKFVAIYCSTDAILPSWAPILAASHLTGYAARIFYAKTTEIDIFLYQEILSGIDYSVYTDKAVIIKGCARKPVPEAAYIMAIQHLQPFAKSIMYGEACSAVPLFKRAKT